VPWAEENSGHSWELSQVTVREAQIKAESDRDGALIPAAKQHMRDHGKFCVVVPLEERDGLWRGFALGPHGEITVTYSPRTGLDTGKGDADESDL